MTDHPRAGHDSVASYRREENGDEIVRADAEGSLATTAA
jgi:hypothetical protein